MGANVQITTTNEQITTTIVAVQLLEILICVGLNCICIMIRGEDPDSPTTLSPPGNEKKRTCSVVCIYVYPRVSSIIIAKRTNKNRLFITG